MDTITAAATVVATAVGADTVEATWPAATVDEVASAEEEQEEEEAEDVVKTVPRQGRMISK